MTKEKQLKAPNATDRYAGIKLREVRQSKNVSQRELASRVNVTFQQIQKYEKGINRMSVGVMYDICTALEISPASFLKVCYKEAKVAEKNTMPIVTEIISNIKHLSTEEQKKLLQYMQKLVKNRNLSNNLSKGS